MLHKWGGNTHYWNIKSTESNESALYFFDNLFAITGETRYRDAADRIYEWLVTQMYDPDNNAFRRGANYNPQSRQWVKDGPQLFATDTTSWAPLERMLNDPRFGSTRLERLQKYESMMRQAERNTGVYRQANPNTGLRVGGWLRGMSYSISAARRGIISIEWSSQFALRYLRIAQEYERLPLNEISRTARTAGVYLNWYKYQDLIRILGTNFITSDNGFPIAPYAVFPNSTIAVNQETGDGGAAQGWWDTSSAFASVASIYYAFALTQFDPLRLVADQAMQSAPHSLSEGSLVQPKARHRADNLGGIDFNPDKLDLQSQNVGSQIKFNMDPAQLAQLQNAPGFVPVIINIQPLSNLQMFLGISNNLQETVG